MGLYKYVRNPMYVGVLLAIVGHFLWFGFWSLLIYAVLLFLAFSVFVIFYEEPNLRQRFGKAYDEYHQRVPRWIPRFK
jgi:protein-S-isoprenylcysteine O-methyltransferase Ste14